MKFLTSGIGSLPHHNIDSAIDFSFRHDVPFLPQLPLLYPREFMVYQSLHRVPGIHMVENYQVSLDVDRWLEEKESFISQINSDLKGENFSSYAPDPSVFSCWNPFVHEADHKESPRLKVQLAGSLTCAQALHLQELSCSMDRAEFLSTCQKVILLSAHAMVESLSLPSREIFVTFDEPAIYSLPQSQPWFKSAALDMELTIHSLKKTGAKVGVHCCSDADWKSLMQLSWDYISFDFYLSYESLSRLSKDISKFQSKGASLHPGLLPFEKNMENLDQKTLCEDLRNFTQLLDLSSDLPLLLTPACGQAGQSIESTEKSLALLKGIATSANTD